MLDRVKESLFQILEGFDAFDGRALDLFAGTGSLGIECLSRGASWCDFVESHAHVAAVIKANLKITQLQDRGRIWTLAVERFLHVA